MGFAKGIGDLIKEAKSCGFKLSKLNAGNLMGKSLLLGRKHRVRFDARFVNLMVAAVVVQGVLLQLNANGDFLARLGPYLFGAALSGSAIAAIAGGTTAQVAGDDDVVAADGYDTCNSS